MHDLEILLGVDRRPGSCNMSWIFKFPISKLLYISYLNK